MRVLLTAFEPYDDWKANSSWLALIELLKQRPSKVDLVTRRYPVEIEAIKSCLDEDLDADFDAVIHTGQSPGATHIRLEAIALNIAGWVDTAAGDLPAIVQDAPLAFRSTMPLADWSASLSAANIPAEISYRAGTYLCNATMFLSHLWFHRNGIQRPVGFVHLPLATQQVCESELSQPSLPVDCQAAALRILLTRLESRSGLSHPTRLA